MGSEGMKYSLVSREVIADSIETVVRLRGHGRLCRHRRLRQKHAGLAYRHGAVESAGRVCLRGHDFARLHSRATPANSMSFPYLKPSRARQRENRRPGISGD